MTLNGIVKRAKEIIERHRMIRGYHRGFVADYLDKEDSNYPVCILQNSGGQISRTQKVGSVSFTMFLLDLVHQSEDRQENELEVQSDMMSIAMDLISLFDEDQDWRVDASNTISFISESNPDNVAGISFEISFAAPWDLNRCAVPID